MVKKNCTQCSEAVIVMLWVNCDEEESPQYGQKDIWSDIQDIQVTDFTILKYHYDTYTKIKAEETVFLAK